MAMKIIVRNYYINCLFCFSVIVSHPSFINHDKNELCGKWNFLYFSYAPKNIIDCERSQNNNEFYVRFDSDSKKGQISAFATRNFITGEFDINSESMIIFKNIFATKIKELTLCGDKFFAAFLKSKSAKINHDTLEIYFSDENNIMKFVREK